MISKDDLFKNGYSTFSLKEFDINLYNQVYKISEYLDSDYREWSFRWQFNTKMTYDDIKKIVDSDDVIANSYFQCMFSEEPNKHKYPNENIYGCEILFNIQDFKQRDYVKNFLINNIHHANIGQYFFEKTIDNYFYNEVNGIIENIYKYFYGNSSNTDLFLNRTTFTFFSKDCFIINHQDGFNPERVCGILIYLTKNYQYETGGHLVLKTNEVITPEIGNVVVLDYTHNNIEHMVTKVTNDSGRSAILKFISKS